MRAFFQRHAVLHIWLLCALLTAAAFHLSKGNRMLMNALAEHVTGPVKETLGAAVRGGAFFCGGSVTFCRGRDPAALSGGFGGRSDPLPSARKPSLHALFRTGVRGRNGLQSVLPALGRQLLHRWISGALRPAG